MRDGLATPRYWWVLIVTQHFWEVFHMTMPAHKCSYPYGSKARGHALTDIPGRYCVILLWACLITLTGRRHSTYRVACLWMFPERASIHSGT